MNDKNIDEKNLPNMNNKLCRLLPISSWSQLDRTTLSLTTVGGSWWQSSATFTTNGFFTVALKLKLSRMVQSSLVTLIHCSNQKGDSKIQVYFFVFFAFTKIFSFLPSLWERFENRQKCAELWRLVQSQKRTNGARLHKIVLGLKLTHVQ